MAGTRRQQLEEMLRDEPNDGELRYFLAMEYVSEGDNEGAVRCFRELFAVAPTYVPAYLQTGQALVRLGRTEEAAEVLRRGITVARQQSNDHARGEMEGLLASLLPG
jgi:thioredoxin-like negative regulator of GroEL